METNENIIIPLKEAIKQANDKYREENAERRRRRRLIRIRRKKKKEEECEK